MSVELLVGVVAVWVAAAVGLGLLCCSAISWARGADEDTAVPDAGAELPAPRRESPLVLDLTTPVGGLPEPRAQSDVPSVSAQQRRPA